MPDHGDLFRPQLDADLPPVRNVTLAEWNDEFDSRSGPIRRAARDIFALTGRFTDEDGVEYRARFDVDKCMMDRNMKIHQGSDIDSVIGVLPDTLPVKPDANFEYFMCPDVKYTLDSNLHIPGVRVPNQGMEEEPVPLHHIPNARFGRVDGALIRIHFPNLRDVQPIQEAPNYVGKGVLTPFYDRAVRPAAERTIDQDYIRTWPARYSSEEFRATPATGDSNRLQQSARGIPGRFLDQWIMEIRRCVAEDHVLSFARGFFFLVEIRGVKESTRHEIPEQPLASNEGNIIDDTHPRLLALDNLLCRWIIEDFDVDNWLVDVGTTISITDADDTPRCAFFRKDKHAEIIRHLTGKQADLCRRWVTSRNGLRCYSNDEIAHLGDIAGFRLDLNNDQPTEDGVYYIQVYSTEKSITYHLEGRSNAKRTSPKKILENWKEEWTNHFVPLQLAFIHAASTHDAAIRIESRVTLRGLPRVHARIPERHLRNWIVQIENTAYWGFKANRMMAINSTIGKLIVKRDKVNLQDVIEVGSLLALLSWMANALVNRPDDGGTWNEVHDAGCVHMQFEHEAIPARPLAMYCLHSLRFERSMPALNKQRIISRDTVLYIISPSRNPPLSLLELLAMIRGRSGHTKKTNIGGLSWGAGDDRRPTGMLPRTNNKQSHVRIRLESEAPDVFQGILPEPKAKRARTEGESDSEEDEELLFSQQVSHIVSNYPIQVFAKAPNCKSLDKSWCKIHKSDETLISSTIFCDASRLNEIFASYNCLGYDGEKWDKTIAHWFPDRSQIKSMKSARSKVQGLLNLGVWEEWDIVLSHYSYTEAKRVVRVVRADVKQKWQWLPALEKNHLWPTGVRGLPKAARQVGSIPGGPWIVLNPRFR